MKYESDGDTNYIDALETVPNLTRGWKSEDMPRPSKLQHY